jgi:hypothetical protein
MFTLDQIGATKTWCQFLRRPIGRSRSSKRRCYTPIGRCRTSKGPVSNAAIYLRVLCFCTGLKGSGVGFSLCKVPFGVGFEPAKFFSVGFIQILKYPLLGFAGLSAGLLVSTVTTLSIQIHIHVKCDLTRFWQASCRGTKRHSEALFYPPHRRMYQLRVFNGSDAITQYLRYVQALPVKIQR